MPARVITILTDFGLGDPFVGMMKGVILTLAPEVQIVDLTHNITPGDIKTAAFFLKQSFKFFPHGSIHIGVVDPGVGGERKAILVQAENHFFVGPDNGLFYPLVADKEFKAFHLNKTEFHLPEVSRTFHGRDIFAPVAAYLSKGVSPQRLGEQIPLIQKLELPLIKKEGKFLRGEIIHIDSFGNLISNIPKTALAGKRVKEVRIKDVVLKGLCRSYSEKKKGELLCLIDSFSLLEISANQAKAAEILKADRGESLEVEFY